MSALIKLEDVCFAYEDIVALKHIDLEIKAGECVVFIGANGCGKSTLLKLINGVIFPVQGKYYFDGNEVNEKSMKNQIFSKTLHKRMGFVFQNSDIQLFCNNVREEIAFGPRQMGLTENEIEKRVDDCLKLMGIEKLSERASFHLSGGEKKKVALASVLSMNPDIFVLDEPLAGLDKKSADFLLDFLKELKQAGKTILISTHNEQLARELADRIIEFDDDHRILN